MTARKTPRTRRFEAGPASDIDLDAEEVFLADGTRLTEARAAELAEKVSQKMAVRHSGRPSVTGAAGKTPGLNIRIPETTRSALEKIANEQGRRLADVGRDAFNEYIERHAGKAS